MNGKNIIVGNIKINQPMKYVLKTDVSALVVQCLNSVNLKRKETGDIEAGNYQSKPFLK